MNSIGGHGAFQHPNFVAIPDAKTEGVRAYREPETPHPLQLQFLTEEGEKAYVAEIRALLAAGQADAADRRLSADLAGFAGAMARQCLALRPDEVVIDGWEDLLPILAEFEGPAISAITVGLTNDRDLAFEGGQEHSPILVIGLYSDDSYGFGDAPAETILAECTADMPAWCGHEEDVEFYADIAGLATLNTALIQNKHRYFLRDGRDGIEGRAPGGYVEYVLGTWVRATRFLQALERAARDHGLPRGARLIAGTAGLQTDFACMVGAAREVAVERASAAKPVASLTMKQWVPKADPLAEVEASGSALRQKLAQPAGAAEEPQAAAEPMAIAPAVTADAAAALAGPPESEPRQAPEPDSVDPLPVKRRRGFFARLFGLGRPG